MRRKPTIVVASIVLCLLLFGYLARVVTVYTFHADACLVIGRLVADKVEKGKPVSDAEVKTEIAELIRASVIHGRVNKDGSPTDLNGNAFLIQRTAERVTASTRFSLLQPMRSQVKVEIKTHNKVGAANSRRAEQLRHCGFFVRYHCTSK